MQKITRAGDNVWKVANSFGDLPNGYDKNGDPVLSDNEFNTLNELYHRGHSDGMHHREQIEFHQDNEDPLSAYDAEREAAKDHDLQSVVMASVAHRPSSPEWHSYVFPHSYSKGFLDALGAYGTSYDGLMRRPNNKEGNMVYDPPQKNDPWGREHP